MENVFRVAILGGGGILSAHAPGWLRLRDQCRVVAVAEPAEDQHPRIRAQLEDEGLPIYTSYVAMLDELGGQLDAVDILLPHDLHLDATLRAAENGLHVLCEKVMARNVYEARQMVRACEEAGVKLMVSHDRRYAGDWVTLKKIVDSGQLGEILFWKMEHNQNVVFPPGAWVRSKDRLGGGAIMSCLTHQIDALRWYGGEVDSLCCLTKTVPERMEGETIGAITARMESGALALLSINWHTQSHSWDGTNKDGLWYEFNHVTGTRGEAYYMHGRGTFVKLFDGPGRTFEYDMQGEGAFECVKAEYELTGHQKCIEAFVQACRGDDAQVLTWGRDTLRTVEVAEAAYIAEAAGKTVRLPVEPTPWEQRTY